MEFKSLKAKCFLSIGEEGIHIDFSKLDSLILIKGKNLDISPESSNAAGKTTVLEAIIYGLFGKLIKGLPHKEVIHKRIKKGLEIELCFEFNGKEYKIIRGRKPDFLQLFENNEEITLGGMPTTQQKIEDIIRLNYDSFINIVCFGEHNNHAFLACDPATKRSIVENLLGLDKYLKYSKIAKENLKETETKLSVLKKKYENLCEQQDSCLRRIDQLILKQKSWIDTKNKEIDQIKAEIIVKTTELTKTDDGNASFLFEEAQSRIKVNKEEMVRIESQRNQIDTLMKQVREKQEKLQEQKNDYYLKIKEQEYIISNKKTEINVIETQNRSLNKLQPGIKCNACYGTVDPCNYQHLIDHNNNIINDLNKTISSVNDVCVNLRTQYNDKTNKLISVNETKRTLDEKNNTISIKLNSLLNNIQKDTQIKEPQIGARELLLKEKISELNKKLESKSEELSNQDPYVDIIKQTKEEKIGIELELFTNKSQIEDGEQLIPYYEFWINGFGDDGIRAFIIDEMLPALNSRINYWLQFLIDNKIFLEFDNKFEAKIDRNPPDGDSFVYNAMSGGEKRRVNLAISQAFAHVMELSCGTHISACFHDEISLNVDSEGAQGIYNMICELSKDKKVFVITHDVHLNDLLTHANVILVTKKNGFTTLKYDSTLSQ